MGFITRFLIFVAMVLLIIVSMWTTYVSLHDSIFPRPIVDIPLGHFGVWECSVIALGLSLAIGIMLFALKLAIIDEQKRLNLVGFVGLCVIAFISIAFNMDVLYRTADREFFLRYSTSKVKDVYVKYLTDVQSQLLAKRQELQKSVAAQEGELDAEIRGLREAPAGYGTRARQEDYHLTVLQKTTEVELQTLEETLMAQRKADEMLRSDVPSEIEEVEQLQSKLRVAVKDAGALAGLPLPEPVKLENPLFAVFSRLFDLKTVGMKELFFLTIAIFLDLGDIVGYCLIPNKPKQRRKEVPEAAPPLLQEPDLVSSLTPSVESLDDVPERDEEGALDAGPARDLSALEPRVRRSSKRSFRFLRH